MQIVDYLIVGTGLTGATIARILRDAGSDVLIVDRRNHIGGNVHDRKHPSKIRVHTYGPHYFRTNSENIWRFMNRFSHFYRFEPTVKTLVDGQYETWPIIGNYIKRVIGETWQPEFTTKPTNFEEACLSMMPRIVYEKFVKGYTEKQWGIPANMLSPMLARRFDVRWDNDPRLQLTKYQGLPVEGYAGMMAKMLEGIRVQLKCDYLKLREHFQVNKCLVFTGPIDEFFGFVLGKLTYRSQMRQTKYISRVENFWLPCGQVNLPQKSVPYVRCLEWKHMMRSEYAKKIQGTLITRETPYTPTDPNHYEYPFPNEENMQLYKRYRKLADNLENVMICGRLGEYRYYDMDQAIARAIVLGEQLLQRS